MWTGSEQKDVAKKAKRIPPPPSSKVALEHKKHNALTYALHPVQRTR